MGFWASAEDPTAPDSMPGYKPTFKVSQPDPYRTPDYEKNKAGVMDLYERRKRTAGPADVVAARAGYVAPSAAGASAQKGAAAMLAASARGDGPSAANAVMGQGKDDAIRARLAAVAAARPTALAQQQATGAAAGALSQAAASSAATKAGEVQSATGQYGATLGAMRGADLAAVQGANKVALSNATMEQQAALQNQKAAMDWYAMSDAEKNALLGMAFGMDQNEMVNRQNYYNFQHGGAMAMNAMNMRDRALRDAQYSNLAMGAGAAGGYAAQAWAANRNQGWDDYEAAMKRGY